MGSEPEPEPHPSLWQNRDFRLLWLGQAVSSYGQQTTAIAFPLLVLASTHSAVKAGLIGSVEGFAIYGGGLAGGWVVDRFDRRRVIIVCDTVRALALAGMAAVVLAGQVRFGSVVALAVVAGLFTIPAGAAQTAALTRIVSRDQLDEAYAQDGARQQGAALGGLGTGGLLFGLASCVPFLVDAVSYLASILGTAAIRTSLAVERNGDGGRAGLTAELTAGVRWLLERRTIALLCVSQSLVNLSVGGIELAIIVLARRAGATSFEVGLVLAAGAAGGVIGSLASARVIRVTGRFGALVLSLWVISVLTAVLSVAPGPVGLGVAFTVALVFFPAGGVVVMSTLAREIPDELRGRVMSVIVPLNAGLGALGPVLAGTLIAGLGSAGALILAVPAAVGAALITWLPPFSALLAPPPGATAPTGASERPASCGS